MDKKEHLEFFTKYYCEHGREINYDLVKLEKFEDVVKKYSESYRLFEKHRIFRNYMREHYTLGNLSSEMGCSEVLEEYSKKVDQLEKIKNELSKKDEVKKKIEEWNSYGKNSSNSNNQPNSNENKQIYYCDKCYKKKLGRFLSHKIKNDGYKFCSTQCYINYYGEYCSRCVNENRNFKKYLKVIQDGDDFYCSPCWEEIKREEKRLEEKLTPHCPYCGVKCPNIFCEKEECIKKIQREADKKRNNDTNVDKSNQIKSNQIKSNQINYSAIWF